MDRENKIGTTGDAGAALITVMLVMLLLGTACIAMLSAVGASSRNNTDSLSEAKAYYAAESGLQATINVLRNTGITYDQAVSDPDMSTWLPYNSGRVDVGTESEYTITVVNPDAALPYSFHTAGSFSSVAGVVSDNSIPKACIPNCLPETLNRTEITINNTPETVVNFGIPKSNPVIGEFQVVKYGTGANIPATGIPFRIEYLLTSPRPAPRTIRGMVAQSAAAAPVVITFPTHNFLLMGSTIELCQELVSPGTTVEGVCPNFTFSLDSGQTSTLRADVTPTEPYRMVVTANGFGPNGARKTLEGILQKNFFNDLASSSAIAMIGPSAGMVFDAGTGGPTYCGVDGGYLPGEPVPNTPPCTPNPNTPSGPSIGVTDPNGLPIVTTGGSGATLNPAPDVITDLPEWQQSPADLDEFIGELRTAAQNDGRYLADTPGTTDIGIPGNHSTGLGITFCEGDCNVGPVDGGGILVVTGRFEYNGRFSFNGLIIVTGAGGMHRTGGGGGQIIGNIVIAPYNASNLAAGFLPPRFTTNGGGNSDIIFGGVSTAFDGTSAITNFMLGVAEK